MFRFVDVFFGGVRTLIMGWSGFYGGLFAGLTGLIIVFGFAQFCIRCVIWTAFLITGHDMHPIYRWQHIAPIVENVRITNAHTYYVRDRGAMLSMHVENPLPYAVMLEVHCIVKPTMKDQTKEIIYSTEVIGRHTSFDYTDEDNIFGYTGPIESSSCTLDGGVLADPWWRPIKE